MRGYDCHIYVKHSLMLTDLQAAFSLAREARLEHQEIADRAGATREYVSRLANGHYCPKGNTPVTQSIIRAIHELAQEQRNRLSSALAT